MNPQTTSPATFAEYAYQRPDMEAFRETMDDLIRQFDRASHPEDQLRALQEIEGQRSRFLSMRSLATIRYTMDTRDAFYEAEHAFFDEQMPHYQALQHRLYQSLVASRHRATLQERWGEQLFRLAEANLRTFAPEIVDQLVEENRLSSAYTKLKAKATIAFRGEEHNLATITKWEEHPDRATRREAAHAKWAFFEEQGEAFDRLYAELVKVRHGIATALGFPNFIPLAYLRLGRTGYGAAKVEAFRQSILRHVVPVANDLYARQRDRLGLDRLLFYDEPFRFPSGNPEPQGNPDWIIARAGDMYAELSEETRTFFRFLSDQQLMDLETRPGKATGGYCTFISEAKAPFIFSNFNGTRGDVDVLTHEAGHAFQIFCSRDLGLQEYYWPTLEACEIHSMSMEFFTWPWMDLFFGRHAPKQRFAHLSSALQFMPYGAAVDAFQHAVYQQPEAGPEAWHRIWRQLERSYLPHRDFDGHPFLEGGRFWQKQSHIFTAPFYYIDYVLAQVCALQFWQRDRGGHEEAWADYVKLCRQGGSLPFLELADLAGLQTPFDEKVVQRIAKEAHSFLDTIPERDL